MDNVLILPILIPFIAAGLCLAFRNSLLWQRVFAGAAAHGLLLVTIHLLFSVRADGLLVLRVGEWPLTYGIVLVGDLMSCLLMVASALTQVAVFWYIVTGAAKADRERALFHPLFLLMTAGVNWAFITGDLFNLFVSFELMLISSYVLVTHGGGTAQLREGFKYLVLNVVAGTLFLIGAGFTYGVFGTLNMADLAIKIQSYENTGVVVALGSVFLLVFGFKAALFPIFFWLPDTYPRIPGGVLPYFAGVLTKVGVYCLYRTFTLMFRIEIDDWFQPVLLAIAGSTMIIGVLGALCQWTFRSILSFHIISQIGYMVFGLALFTELGIAAGIFYIFHQILVKSALFMIGGAVRVNEGSDNLKRVTGLVEAYPWLAIAFLFAAFSLGGIPPLSGFYGKYALVVEGLNQGFVFYVAISLVTSLCTTYCMIKIWKYAFWGERIAGPEPLKHKNHGVIVATWGLVLMTVLVAVFSRQIMIVSTEASKQIFDQRVYIEAVLGERGVLAFEEASAGRMTAAALLEAEE
ncbi:MAG: proton-conducting transporter membrane subunit [Sumerlaeia bacterium]